MKVFEAFYLSPKIEDKKLFPEEKLPNFQEAIHKLRQMGYTILASRAFPRGFPTIILVGIDDSYSPCPKSHAGVKAAVFGAFSSPSLPQPVYEWRNLAADLFLEETAAQVFKADQVLKGHRITALMKVIDRLGQEFDGTHSASTTRLRKTRLMQLARIFADPDTTDEEFQQALTTLKQMV